MSYLHCSLACLLLCLPWLAPAAEHRPNILIMVADDLGYADLGCQGAADLKTPHLDSIAANGVRFTNGYVTGCVCSPSRAGIVTGRYQQRCGHDANPKSNFGLDLKETTMAQRMKAAGYVTGITGKWHLGGKDHPHENVNIASDKANASLLNQLT